MACRNQIFMLCIVLLPIFFAGYAISGTTGKIAGRVLDVQSGEALIGTNIILQGTNRGTATDSRGNFYLLNIPPGEWTLMISMIGYEKKIIRNLRVSSDYTTTVNVRLKQTVINGKTIVVTAKRPLIQKDLTSTAAAIPESRIAELPVERMEELIKLQSGVTVDPKGKIHIRGGRATEVAYLIDGIPVTDAFDRTLAIPVENSGIQELQVISGTFNAEYGQAQSGIINIITKKGSSDFAGEMSLYSGDFLSPHNNLFYNLDNTDFFANQNVAARISGPILKTGATFFLSARTALDDGWLYGQRLFMMPTIDKKVQGYTTNNSNSQPGDSAYLPMNDFKRYSIQGNISLATLKNFPVSYSVFFNRTNKGLYDHRFSQLPEADGCRYINSLNHILNMKYILSAKTFFSFNYSTFTKRTKRYLYNDPLDVRYLFPAVSTEQIYRRYLLEGLEYVTNQSNNDHYDIHNHTQILKLDFTSQVHPLHLIKAGLEYKRYQLDYDYFQVVNRPDNKVEHLFLPMVDDVGTPRHDVYTNKPREAAFFLQDKIEFHEIIVNAGLRFDYFNSNGNYPYILNKKEGNRLSAPREKASPKN